jgi:hypothetical protein
MLGAAQRNLSNATLQAQIGPANVPNATHLSDAPVPNTLRTISGSTRSSGALHTSS